MTCREATGFGFSAFTMVSAGAETVSGASEPALFGMSCVTVNVIAREGGRAWPKASGSTSWVIRPPNPKALRSWLCSGKS